MRFMDIFEILGRFGIEIDKENSRLVDTKTGETIKVSGIDSKVVERMIHHGPVVSEDDIKTIEFIDEMIKPGRYVNLTSSRMCIQYHLSQHRILDGSMVTILDSFSFSKLADTTYEHLWVQFESSRAGNSRLEIDAWANDEKIPLKDVYRKQVEIFENDCIAFDITENGDRRAGLYRDGVIDRPELLDNLNSVEAVDIFSKAYGSFYPGILLTVNRAKSLVQVR